MTSQKPSPASPGFNVRTFIAVATLALSAAAAHAGAGSDKNASTSSAPVPQIAVSYSDLDLNSAEGTRELYRRIERAAAKVCPATSTTGSVIGAPNRRCMSEVIARAVSATDNAQLAELQAARNRNDSRS